MHFWFWGALAAALGGVAIGALCYLLSRLVLLRQPGLFAYLSFGRQLLQVGYLAALYFLQPLLPWPLAALLVGGAVGLTAAMVFSTRKLMKLSQQQPERGEQNG